MNLPHEELVVVDICVWAAFFSRSGGGLKQAVAHLLKRDRVAVVGPIITEVLLGFRNVRHADWVSSRLDGVTHLSIDRPDWRHAAALGRRLARNGHKLPLTDLIIATVCRRLHCAVLTTDPHFDLIDNLQRFLVSDL